MSDPVLSAKLDRIHACANEMYDELHRSLLHAYVACLSHDELRRTAIASLDGPQVVLAAIRSRLNRLGKEDKALPDIDALGRDLLQIVEADHKIRARVEALLSHIYIFLSAPTRQFLLDRWRDRGGRGAGGRWLKAISGDDFLFTIDAVLDYWKDTRDEKAAKVLATRADAALLEDVLPDLVEHCQAGWIISRAALGANSIPDYTFNAIREKFPATFAYLCAKTGRKLSDKAAYEIIIDSVGGAFGDRGLAIWAIGQLNMPAVLDRVWDAREGSK
ncbi:hypothetical protein [Rhizobium indigoferae]|jgi:hypothetical protein|uniref:DNA alkylation repair protein n=1 Tax=Rhizobium indigoferae TaxID=158891 RepID=A0ABZ1DV58_9HYPH|nr:hypothetical protein [Rhizobium indigoferae]NNU55575.1 hypothetical protein [Rhizobium indigoferae]WRW39425.1 hypothetical protein U5G49_006501 [Rhizobium indigoferae]GLR56811.1 hypothetical protein GCM10007919_15350 [Rhizobium indigoferae]